MADDLARSPGHPDPVPAREHVSPAGAPEVARSLGDPGSLPAREPVVELRGVRRAFGGVMALDGFDLAVPAGTVTVLLGPNGAGKTTALRVMTGALVPDDGSARVFGDDPSGPAGESIRGRIGVVAAKPSLYDRLTGRDNLLYAAELYGLGRSGPTVDAAIEGAAARFGIEHALGLRVGGYSTGMKTRLALARAVLHEPDLLLLDEPTSGLDPESAHAVLELIDGLAASGRTVVMCTHLLLEAEGLADNVVMMDAGRAAVAGPPADLVKRYWPHPEVAIGASDPDRLASVSAGLTGVVGSERDGDRVRLRLDDIGRVPALVSALAGAGVEITRVVPHEPTLEQLYLHVRRESRR